MKKLSTTDFIERSKTIHNNIYDYSNVVYIQSKQYVKIICVKHGEFNQRPNDHLSGYGCPNCALNRKLTKDEFINRSNIFHKNYYDYSKIIFSNTETKVEIVCPVHGSFYQTPHSHKYFGCDKCGGTANLTTEDFIKKAKLIYDNSYDYSKVDYKKNHIKIKIICPKHGSFSQTPSNHLNQHGCPKCSKLVSKGEIGWLDKLNISNRQFYIKIPGKRRGIFADGFDPQTNTVYEFLGDYWHGNPDKFNLSDLNKTTKTSFGQLYEDTFDKFKLLLNLGYRLIYIWENDWNKL